MDKVNILGTHIDNVTQKEAVLKIVEMLNSHGTHSVFTPNSEIVLMGYHDRKFCDILNSADLLTADGIGVVYASKIIGEPLPERVSGYDIACDLIDIIAESGHRLYLFGGKPDVAELAAQELKKIHPLLNIVGMRNGYFTKEEVPQIIDDINASGADLVFVCLGAPLQEKWIFENRNSINAHVLMGIGGSLDVFAGLVERAPDIWCKMGLEWLYRLIKEPWRFKRMLALPKFGFTVLLHGRKFKEEK